MTTFIFANNIETSLAGGISSASTSLTLSSTLNLPTSIPAGSYLVLTLNDQATRTNYEIVYATAISGATVTVLRAQEGTSAKAWLTGDFCFSGPTAGQMQNFQQISPTGVTPGTYGSSTQVPQFTVNAAGQITAASNVAIAFPITSFNGRAGAIVLNTGDVTTALGYTPINKAGDTGIGALTMTGALTVNNVVTGQNFVANNATTASTSINLQNTSAGGRNWFLISAGSAWGGGLPAGTLVIYDGTSGGSTAAFDTSGNMTIYRGGLSLSNGSIAAVSTAVAWTGLSLQNTSTGGHSWRLLSVGSTWGGGLVAGYFTIYDDAGGNRLSIDPSGNVTVFNNLTVAGTINFGTSDRTLKDHITEVEPQPLHRKSPLVNYHRWDLDQWGRGLIAQDLIAQQPLYGHEYLHIIDGKSVPKLAISETKAALEQSWWCGRQVDELLERVEALERQAET